MSIIKDIVKQLVGFVIIMAFLLFAGLVIFEYGERGVSKKEGLNDGQEKATTMIMAKANSNSKSAAKIAQLAIHNTNEGVCWKDHFKDLRIRNKGDDLWVSREKRKEEKIEYSEKGLLAYTSCYLGELNKLGVLTKENKELDLLVDEGKEMLVIFKN